MAAKKKATRTVLYSSAGKKLYAKRDAGGKFRDIQSYQRAHAADLRQTSKSEVAAKAAPKKRVAAKKVAAKNAKTQAKSVGRKAPARQK